MQGIWDWPWEGTLLTNGRWDGSQKSCYSLTLFTSGTPGPSCPRDRVSQGLETLVSGLPGPVFPLTTSIHVACGRPLPSPSAQQRCLPLGQQPGKRWVTNGMSDLSAFFPHPALLVSLLAPPRPPPGVFMLPRKRPGRTCLGWRDETFGSPNKKGREIESDTWHGLLPGQHATDAGPHPGKALPGRALAGGPGRDQEWVRRGTAAGAWGVGGPDACGDGKLEHWSWRARRIRVLTITTEGGIREL